MLDTDPLWYRDAIIYQAHVKSFCDSDDDGLGDFRGLASKLDYLHDLGITALWILPFYPSPLRDDGYDIADYTTVNPQYGSLRDFQDFLEAAHRRGIRVITELVINHTSDQHPWFQRARLAPPGSVERNFYVWSDTPDKYKGVRIIFKDFERSNWTWDSVAGAYFWHRFYSHQPDLNYDNPAVWDAIFPLVDFWFGMGVDGLRLDAVPYLYEREGTTCENLPETHAFLKALRAHVDAKFQGRMLLAEANQWPEDAVDYFGSGDECHMCFHFPVMPRLFMAVQQENSFPILDIMAQTPGLPELCQWAIFLRNHDELTLEMVTEEERDFMYRAYAEDPQARINLGIRRRLAPLLDNDRRRLELMNALLMSLPGTPVLYYGDEIGMGDNIYLGDRNGVRTPMQWSPDRNAGFSRTNPQQLYLPVIIDPEYHFESINVEAQQNNTSSLLWWTKRLIALRKSFRAFGRGTLEFLRPTNPKVLAFVRRYSGVGGNPVVGEEQILVVANLSRFVQYAELDLRAFQGRVPQELFGGSLFPPVGDKPYSLSLGPYSFYWFTLTVPAPLHASAPGPEPAIPLLSVREGWQELFTSAGHARLEALLPGYLERRGEPVQSAHIGEAFPLRYGDSTGYVLLVRVEDDKGIVRTDLISLTLLPASSPADPAAPVTLPTLLRPAREAILARVGGTTQGLLCDALADPDFCRGVLQAIVQGRGYGLSYYEALVSTPLNDLETLVGDDPDAFAPEANQAEQANFSIRFGQPFLLKVFRRVEEGPHPEVELCRFLTERRGYTRAPTVLGTIEFRRRQTRSCLAVLQRYLEHQANGWQLALDNLSRYFERITTIPAERQHPPARVALLGPPEPAPDSEAEDLLGPFRAASQLVGQRTAELHHALTGEPTDPVFAPEPFTRPYQRSLYQSLRNEIGDVVTRLGATLPELSEPARSLARRVLDGQSQLLDRCRFLRERSVGGARIHCHGDLQLGNLLYTGNDFLFIDFEGDPDRPLGERRLKRSPLRDLACLVRSLHYAAHSALLGLATTRGRTPGVIRPEDRALLEPWAAAWAQRIGREFVTGYLQTTDGVLLPSTAHERGELLGVFVLEKALREIAHELEHRRDWLVIPLLGVVEFLG